MFRRVVEEIEIYLSGITYGYIGLLLFQLLLKWKVERTHLVIGFILICLIFVNHLFYIEAVFKRREVERKLREMEND